MGYLNENDMIGDEYFIGVNPRYEFTIECSSYTSKVYKIPILMIKQMSGRFKELTREKFEKKIAFR